MESIGDSGCVTYAYDSLCAYALPPRVARRSFSVTPITARGCLLNLRAVGASGYEKHLRKALDIDTCLREIPHLEIPLELILPVRGCAPNYMSGVACFLPFHVSQDGAP